MNPILNTYGEKLDTTYHSGTKADVLLVLGHGLTGNKDRPLLVALAEGLSAKGWPCLRLSYAGNGDSEGAFEDATISKEIGDLAALIQTIPADTRIAYIGHSMGAAVGVLAAASNPRIHTLVSLAGMVHTAEFFEAEFGEIEPNNGFMWDNEDCPLSQKYADDLNQIGSVIPAASTLQQAWLLIHGTADDVVPIHHSRDAFAAAKCPKKLLEIPEAGHSFDETSYPQMIESIHSWLEGYFLK